LVTWVLSQFGHRSGRFSVCGTRAVRGPVICVRMAGG
jgi:hypothetical protein